MVAQSPFAPVPSPATAPVPMASPPPSNIRIQIPLNNMTWGAQQPSTWCPAPCPLPSFIGFCPVGCPARIVPSACHTPTFAHTTTRGLPSYMPIRLHAWIPSDDASPAMRCPRLCPAIRDARESCPAIDARRSSLPRRVDAFSSDTHDMTRSSDTPDMTRCATM